jgi:hypothetical protein
MHKITREKRLLFAANRLLIVLAIAAILAGLYLEEWTTVLNNARILCYSCIGFE